MKKKHLGKIFGTAAAVLMLAACGKETEQSGGDSQEVVDLTLKDGTVSIDPVTGDQQPTQETEPAGAEETGAEEVVPEGMYRSELTNEIIDESLKNQRPIAVMVDNEKTALPHYGVSDADIVYELMNSTKNGRITRLMPIVKDWQSITQFGSIRSARPTNFMIAAEWNAILCHDGGPYYINDFVYPKKSYTNNLSGGFARFPNGKQMEYTEYITYNSYTNPNTGKSYDGLGKRIEAAHYSTEYNDYYPGQHFIFSDTELTLSDTHSDAFAATEVDLSGCFPHNSSMLKYNDEIGKYEYYEYGSVYVDEGNNNQHLTFENVILQKVNYTQLDENGYMIYNCVISSPWDAYLLQNGEAIPITWVKYGEGERTVFWNKDGTEIVLNTGKTYIAMVPDDVWKELKIK